MARGGYRLISGSEDFLRLADRLDEGDRKLASRIRKRLRDVAKPLGSEVRDSLADAMPRRGGLSDLIAASKVSVASTGASRHPRVEIRVRSAGHDLESMDAGSLRHPTFGHRPWVGQSVPSGSAQDALDRGAPKVRDALAREVEAILDEIGD